MDHLPRDLRWNHGPVRSVVFVQPMKWSWQVSRQAVSTPSHFTLPCFAMTALSTCDYSWMHEYRSITHRSLWTCWCKDPGWVEGWMIYYIDAFGHEVQRRILKGSPITYSYFLRWCSVLALFKSCGLWISRSFLWSFRPLVLSSSGPSLVPLWSLSGPSWPLSGPCSLVLCSLGPLVLPSFGDSGASKSLKHLGKK